MKFTALMFLLSLAAPAAAQTLSGRVTDANTDAPLPARVEVVDTGVAVTAGSDGRFVVAVPSAERTTIVCAYPGYYVHRQGIDTRNTTTLEVRLVPIVTLEDRIEVTATRAREGADPATFTNVPREAVADAHWGQDPAILLAQLVPGVYATNDNGNGIGYSYFSIRGFGQSRTRVMLNGAPLNDAESGELFFIDLADFMATAGDVQVQRGVLGLSGLGGAIDLTTASPAVVPSFSVHAGAGSFETRRLMVQAESGLVKGAWAFSGRYSKITTDGYRDQSWVDMWNYYFALARYGERSRVRAVLFGGPERTHLAYVGVPEQVLAGGLTGDADRDRRYNPLTYPGEIDNFLQPHYQIVHDASLSERTRFSQTIYTFQGKGYYDQFRANRRLYEYALPNVRLPDGTLITRSDLVRRRNVDEWDAGWVPSLAHEFGRVSLDVKAEVRIHRARHIGEVTWAQFYPTLIAPNHRYYDYRVGKTTATTAAAARVPVGQRVALTAGLQVSSHRYELSDDRLKGMAFTRDFRFVLPRAGAVVTLGSSGHVYVHVARGMREPFFRNLYDPQDYYATPAALDPEDVWNVEAGVSLRQSSWRLRANTFWMNFLNEIVYAGALDDNGVPIYGNGARSRRQGVEIDGSLTLAPRVGIDATLAVSRNRFTRYREFDFEGGAAVYDGNRVAGFPDVMASIVAHATIGRSRVSLAARRIGRFYLDNTQDDARVNRAYTSVDAVAKVALPERLARGTGCSRIDLDVRVNNLFDRRYATFGYVDDGLPVFIPAARRAVYVGLTFGL
ncbi:MAG: TonB-dependent receptor [Acidobacteriota bacterium]